MHAEPGVNPSGTRQTGLRGKVDITSPLQLPCGVTLGNRLCKAALTEGLADEMNRATARHERLYQAWSEGGAGLVITGNVQIDRRYLERPGNVVIDGNGGLDALRRYAAAGTVEGNHLWMQINHPGRQTPVHVCTNRARFLWEVVRACRAAASADFPIGVKLNSSDFQQGGFSADDSLQVVRWLGEDGVDLLELSGGSYEQPSMMGVRAKGEMPPPVAESTRRREAYFLDYARTIRTVATMPIMVTGGFRSRAAMDKALHDGGLPGADASMQYAASEAAAARGLTGR